MLLCGREAKGIMADEAARNYLRDLGALVREQAEDAEARSDAFESGRAMAYYEVTSLMLSQAAAFGLRPEDVGLAGFEPTKLLGSSRT